MAKTYQYCVAENWGKGFIDHDESFRITGVVKTKDEAQALVDAEVQAAQAAWDALPDDQKTEMNPRPADVTLEE